MKKPNIIFIFSDQHRKASMGFWQNEEYKKHIKGEPDPVVTPNLDALAKDGNDKAYHLPVSKLDDNPYDMSFSGLKTAVINLAHNSICNYDLVNVATVLNILSININA